LLVVCTLYGTIYLYTPVQQQRLSMAAAAQSFETPTAASAPAFSSQQDNVRYIRPRGVRAGWQVQLRRKLQTSHVTSSLPCQQHFSQQQQPRSMGQTAYLSSSHSATSATVQKIDAIRTIAVAAFQSIERVDRVPLVRSRSANRQLEPRQPFRPAQSQSMPAWQHGASHGHVSAMHCHVQPPPPPPRPPPPPPPPVSTSATPDASTSVQLPSVTSPPCSASSSTTQLAPAASPSPHAQSLQPPQREGSRVFASRPPCHECSFSQRSDSVCQVCHIAYDNRVPLVQEGDVWVYDWEAADDATVRAVDNNYMIFSAIMYGFG
jgi:hypothetical protein